MKKMILLVSIVTFALGLLGCSGKEQKEADTDALDKGQMKETQGDTAMKDEKNMNNSKTEDTSSDSQTQNTKEETVAAADLKAAESTITPAEPTPVPEGLVLPLTTNASGKVMIQTVSKSASYPYNSYIITSINGESVILDPTSMPKKEEVNLKPAAILSTHSHPDHIDDRFFNAYDCEKLLYKKGEINTKDFHIYTIQCAHDGDVIAETSLNVIIVVEVDGLRIAHMGDIGQTTLTEEQLKELGAIDIAFMQFENPYSNMSLENRKGFNMMEQLKPKIIIPTHYTDAALPVFEADYGTITEVENVLEIAKKDIPEQTCMYRILNKHVYK